MRLQLWDIAGIVFQFINRGRIKAPFSVVHRTFFIGTVASIEIMFLFEILQNTTLKPQKECSGKLYGPLA